MAKQALADMVFGKDVEVEEPLTSTLEMQIKRSQQMKQFQAHKFSDRFIQLLGNKTLDINEYDYCVVEWAKAHESKMIRYYIYTAIFFIGGMWAVFEQIWFMAVLLLALAANYNRQSSHHILMSEIMRHQRLLAVLVNKVSKDMQSDASENETEKNDDFNEDYRVPGSF